LAGSGQLFWGIAGVLLATPLLVALKVTAEHALSGKAVLEFLGPNDQSEGGEKPLRKLVRAASSAGFRGGKMPSFGVRLVGGLLLSVAAAIVAHAQPPKRVLMLHSFGPEFGDFYARDMRVRLGQQLSGQFVLYDEWLVSARFAESPDDAAFASYLTTLFADHPIDLVISLGAPAADFLQRYRQSLLNATPKLLTTVEQRLAWRSNLIPNATAVAMSVSFPAVVENILRVQPGTSTVAVVIGGKSSNDKYWAAQIRDTLRPFTNRVTLTFLNELPFSDMLKRAATLPPRSAILYVLLSREVEGIPQDEDTAIAELHAVTNAPIFSFTDAYLGKGIVGGPMISSEELSRTAMSVATRLLSGENASDIRTPPISLGKPKFDWRELKRWSIRESDLPPGSSILFREPSAWERYRWQIVSVVVVLALETALIATLLRERRRRRIAEMDAHKHMVELARMNRRSAVGELSASIAHELAQPLGAILRNTEAAELLLQAAVVPPQLVEIKDIVADIGRDQRRASEVIRRVRGLLARAPTESREIDLNDVVREVFEFLAAQAAANHIALGTSLALRPLLISGDGIEIQQVILNLVMNALEAIRDAGSVERNVNGYTSLVSGVFAEVAIEDSGPGIAPDQAEHMFEAFFTTKDTGMGMGLSIARTIVGRRGGRIWAESRRRGGAVVRFTVPLAGRQRDTDAVNSTVSESPLGRPPVAQRTGH
jgi:signal transduction histidine kinase